MIEIRILSGTKENRYIVIVQTIKIQFVFVKLRRFPYIYMKSAQFFYYQFDVFFFFFLLQLKFEKIFNDLKI